MNEITFEDVIFESMKHEYFTISTFDRSYDTDVFDGKTYYGKEDDVEIDNIKDKIKFKSKSEVINDYGVYGLSIELILGSYEVAEDCDVDCGYTIPILTEDKFNRLYQDKYPFVEDKLDINNDFPFDDFNDVDKDAGVDKEEWNEFRREVANEIARKIRNLPECNFKDSFLTNLFEEYVKNSDKQGDEFLVDEDMKQYNYIFYRKEIAKKLKEETEGYYKYSNLWIDGQLNEKKNDIELSFGVRFKGETVEKISSYTQNTDFKDFNRDKFIFSTYQDFFKEHSDTYMEIIKGLERAINEINNPYEQDKIHLVYDVLRDLKNHISNKDLQSYYDRIEFIKKTNVPSYEFMKTEKFKKEYEFFQKEQEENEEIER